MNKPMTKTCGGVLLILGLLASLAHAQGTYGQSPAKATLLAYQTAIQPGKTCTLGVLITPDDGWHTYWVNPGESGLPTKINWELPDGFTVSDIQWPTPHVFETGGILGLGYPGPVLLTVKLQAPQKLQTNTITVKAKVSWLVCKEACIPGRANLSMALPVNQTAAIDTAHQKLFDETITHLPKPLILGKDAITLSDGKLTLTLPDLQWPKAVFYAAHDSLIDVAATQTVDTTTQPGHTTITIPLSMYAPKTITQIKGVIVTNPHDKHPTAYAVDIQLQP